MSDKLFMNRIIKEINSDMTLYMLIELISRAEKVFVKYCMILTGETLQFLCYFLLSKELSDLNIKESILFKAVKSH